MKRILSIIIVMALCISLAACGGSPSGNDSTENKMGTDSAAEISETPSSEENEAEKESVDAEADEPKGESYEITYQNAKTWVNSIGTTWVQVIVEITNTGSENLYLSSGAYDLEDAEGNLIASQSLVSAYPNVLAPGEKGYMYEETTLDNFSGDGELTILPRPSVERAKVNLVRYSISDVAVSDKEYVGISVLGRVENTTDEAAEDMIYIVAFFYDENNDPIGSAFTILTETLEPGAKIGFELTGFSMPDDITADAVSNTADFKSF